MQSYTMRSLARQCRRYLSPRIHRVIDAGAHTGEFAQEFADALQTECFEPNARLLPALHTRLRHHHNYTLHNTALSNAIGTCTMTDLEDPGLNYIESLAGTTAMTTLDAYEFDAVDLIKIDVEGAEFEVIEGAEQTIRRNRPVICVETNHLSERYGHSKAEMIAVMQELGYRRVWKGWPNQIYVPGTHKQQQPNRGAERYA